MMLTSDIGEGDRRRMPCAKCGRRSRAEREWIVDADLKDFFGSVDHEKLLTLVAQRVADGRVLRLIKAMLKAGSYGKGRLFPSERGTPQGGVVSPLLSNILLTPFDQEMRRKGYQLTRYADDWVVTCESAAEARAAVAAALRILNELGVQLHPQKTRIVHVQQGFEFLGYKIKRGKALRLAAGQDPQWCAIGGAVRVSPGEIGPAFHGSGAALTRRRVPLETRELIDELNPVLRGWGHYYKRAHVRKLFHRLDGWIRAAHLVASIQALAEWRLATVAGNQAVRRVRAGQPDSLIPSIASARKRVFVKAACGKTARTV